MNQAHVMPNDVKTGNDKATNLKERRKGKKELCSAVVGYIKRSWTFS